MKRAYVLWVVCAVSLAGLLGGPADASGATKSKAGAKTVTMKSLSFDPEKLEVHAGDSVVWANKAHATHTATSDDDRSTFDTGDVEPGKSSKAVKFGKEGEFPYHCNVHGKSMSGTIVVKKATN